VAPLAANSPEISNLKEIAAKAGEEKELAGKQVGVERLSS
jgi:hypothetical protein